ncbi:MAG TPA: hypothetical protein PKY82_13075 [Pyrinomonadaceae bacterium]|nr:hypothetical protein [Pyrinomonadaceae bacterium]
MNKLGITISLNRGLNQNDEKAVSFLMSQWLVYDAEFKRKHSSAEIKLFHTAGAKPYLIKELTELFPGENMNEM